MSFPGVLDKSYAQSLASSTSTNMSKADKL